jgi:hypothetical protein
MVSYILFRRFKFCKLWENHGLDTKLPLIRELPYESPFYILKKLGLYSLILIVGKGHTMIYLSDIFKASVYMLLRIA